MRADPSDLPGDWPEPGFLEGPIQQRKRRSGLGWGVVAPAGAGWFPTQDLLLGLLGPRCWGVQKQPAEGQVVPVGGTSIWAARKKGGNANEWRSARRAIVEVYEIMTMHVFILVYQ